MEEWDSCSILVESQQGDGGDDEFYRGEIITIHKLLEAMMIMIIRYSTRPDKNPNLIVSPMMKEKDKPYFADAFPYLMLSRWKFFLCIWIFVFLYLYS